MGLALTALEKNLRRMERNRLQAFLRYGGVLIREELPAGQVTWCRASRSGHPFSNRCVTRLLKRGKFVWRSEGYWVIERDDGSVSVTGSL